MADLVARQVVTGVALVAATAQTMIQLLSATNQRVKIKEIGVSFNGQVNTNTPVLVQGMLQTSAGTASSGTPVAIDGDIAETIQTVTKVTYTVEPSYSSIFFSWYVHPQTGIILPLSTIRPIVLKGAQRFGLLLTAPQVVNANCHIEFEE